MKKNPNIKKINELLDLLNDVPNVPDEVYYLLDEILDDIKQ